MTSAFPDTHPYVYVYIFYLINKAKFERMLIKKALHKKVQKKISTKYNFFSVHEKKVFFVRYFFSYFLLTIRSIWPPTPTHLFADVILEWSPARKIATDL